MRIPHCLHAAFRLLSSILSPEDGNSPQLGCAKKTPDAVANSNDVVGLTDGTTREYWRDVLLDAGPRAKTLEHVCSVRIHGAHWHIAHLIWHVRECIENLGRMHIVRPQDVAASVQTIVADLAAGLFLEGRRATNTDLVSLGPFTDRTPILFVSGRTAEMVILNTDALNVTIPSREPDAWQPNFYLVARTRHSMVDFFVVSSAAVSTWAQFEDYRWCPLPESVEGNSQEYRR